MNNNFAEWLNQELNKRNWSIRELSRRSPISHSAIAQVIKGNEPSWKFCAEIAPALKMSPIDIFIMAGKLNPKDETERPLILPTEEEEDKIETPLILPTKEEIKLKRLDPLALQIAQEINALTPRGRKAAFNAIEPLLTEIRQLTTTIHKP